MDTLTTAQIRARLVEWQRIAGNGAYDTHLRKTARRAVKLYTAELALRQS
jgi:hypothetical protein